LRQTDRKTIEAARSDATIAARPYTDVVALLQSLDTNHVDVGHWNKALDDAVLGTAKWGTSTANGMSLYFPINADEAFTLSAYDKLAFAKETGWSSFLEGWLKGPT
jgi:hypothetical protein